MKLYLVIMSDDGWSGKMATIKEIDTWDLWNTSNYDGIEFSRTPVSGIHKSRSDAEAYIESNEIIAWGWDHENI